MKRVTSLWAILWVSAHCFWKILRFLKTAIKELTYSAFYLSSIASSIAARKMADTHNLWDTHNLTHITNLGSYKCVGWWNDANTFLFCLPAGSAAAAFGNKVQQWIGFTVHTTIQQGTTDQFRGNKSVNNFFKVNKRQNSFLLRYFLAR